MLRLSGPSATEALRTLSGRDTPPPRMAVLRDISCPSTGAKIDRCLALFFPGPASFTGEDVVELHLHGSRAVSKAALRSLGAIPGLRVAEPGEFSRRAFLNGKMDLTELEGLADLIDAETEAQRAAALDQMGGGLKRLYEGWREELVRCLAHFEAAIDFGEASIPLPSCLFRVQYYRKCTPFCQP